MASNQGALTIARFVTKTLTLTSISSNPSTSHATPTMIKFYVSENRQIYEVPCSLLREKCPYFRACLGPPFAEGMIRELHLGREDVVAFEQFVAWMGNENLTVKTSLVLAMTFILAEKFLMDALKNAVMEKAILASREMSIGADGLFELCRNGLSQSLLGRFFWAQLAYERIEDGFGWYFTGADRAGALVRLIRVPEYLVTFTAVLEEAQHDYENGELVDPSDAVGCLTFTKHKDGDSGDENTESGNENGESENEDGES
jgi:hypothetical protein